MEFHLHDTPQSFRDKVWAWLVEREAENNLMLGIVGRLVEGHYEAEFLCTVEEGGRVCGCALRTPPYRAQISRMKPELAARLAKWLHAKDFGLQGVSGPTESALAFAQAWPGNGQTEPVPTKSLRTYELDRVVPAPPPPGAMVPAQMDDVPLLVDWKRAMAAETGMLMPNAEEEARRNVERQEFFFWRDERLVSMARATGGTPNGVRIGLVYTPPEHRRKGYATSLVEALSRRMLEAGKRFCFLFTDLDNPTSNSIYQKIGYRPVCDFAEYDFD